jgi:cytochrome c oxidase cbb3-type subunit III
VTRHAAHGALFAALATGVLGGCARSPAPASATTTPVPPAVRYESHLEAGGIAPPGATLTNPHAGDAAVAKSGAQLFNSMNCDGCHGEDATGNWAPNLGTGRWRYGGADSEVFSSIFYGRPRGMPAFGGALGPEGVWTLVTYLRTLPPPPNMPTESWQEKP